MKKSITLLAALISAVTMMYAEIYSGTYPEHPDFSWTINDENGVLTINGMGEIPGYGEMGGPWAEEVSYEIIHEVVVTEGITAVAEYNFYYYFNIETITLPSTLVTFKYGAISGCSSLKNIRFAGMKPPVYNGGNYGLKSIVLTVPYGAKDAYEEAWATREEFFSVEEGDVPIVGKTTLLPDTTVCPGQYVAIGDTEGKIFYTPGTLTAIFEAGDGTDSVVSRKVFVKSLVLPYVYLKKEEENINTGSIRLYDAYAYSDAPEAPVYKAEYDYITINGVRYDHSADHEHVAVITTPTPTATPSFELPNLSAGTYTIGFYSEECGLSNVASYTIQSGKMRVNNLYYNIVTEWGVFDNEYKRESFAELTSPLSGSYGLTEVVIPEKITIGENELVVRRIGSQAFETDKTIRSLTIPASVSQIYNYAFYGCTNLKEIYVFATTPPSLSSASSVFYNLASGAEFYVPLSACSTYKSGYGWKNYTIQPAVTVSAVTGPTHCVLSFDGIIEEVAACAIKGGERTEGASLEFIGLTPNSTYSNVEFVLYTPDNKSGEMTYSFSTTALTLKTLESKATSSTTALLLAETNIDEIETACGFEWKRHEAPSDMKPAKEYATVKNGIMAGRLKGLKDDVYYQYRAFYESAAGDTYYGAWQYIFTGDAGVVFEPVVYTESAKEVKENEAVLRGYALAGSDEITEQGFEYWASSPLLGQRKTIQAEGIAMEVTLRDLEPATKYKFRAYAVAGGKTFYGAERAFITQGGYEGDDEFTDIDAVETPQPATKILRNGQLYILKGQKIYTITGQEVR